MCARRRSTAPRGGWGTPRQASASTAAPAGPTDTRASPGRAATFRASLREMLHPLDAVGLVVAQEVRGKRGRVHAGMEEVHMRVMEAGGDEGVAIVDYLRLGASVGFVGKRKRVFLRSDERDLVPGNGDGKLFCAIGQTGEYVPAAKNAVDSHVGQPFLQTMKAQPDDASFSSSRLSAFRFRHMPARIYPINPSCPVRSPGYPEEAPPYRASGALCCRPL